MSEAVQDRPGLPHEIDPREFDGAAFQRDPFPLYKRLRDHHPVFHDRFHNRWALTRYWDIDGAFQDNDSYDRAVYKPDGPYQFGSTHVFGPNILEYGNSPRHLGFGIGQHFCMGYAMARQESMIACAKLVEALGKPRPKFADHPGINSPSIDSGGFRSPEQLWLKF